MFGRNYIPGSQVKSKSTDKLRLLMAALPAIPEETLSRLKSFELDWKLIDGTAVPIVTATFKD